MYIYLCENVHNIQETSKKREIDHIPLYTQLIRYVLQVSSYDWINKQVAVNLTSFFTLDFSRNV